MSEKLQTFMEICELVQKLDETQYQSLRMMFMLSAPTLEAFKQLMKT